MQEVVAFAQWMQNDKVDVVTPPAPPAMHFTRVERIIHGDTIISHNEHAHYVLWRETATTFMQC
jgi:hypothetical protein